jgi:stearoyl-CoA desaturase (delta-9 desaturase)
MLEMVLVLVMTHITIVCVTVYLHRCQAHRALTLHPAVSHFMRFWLWLTTGMITKEWVAVHRRHHQKCEQPGDPHSPQVFGFWTVLLGGAFLYARAAEDRRLVEEHGKGTPRDWIERKLYTPHHKLGFLALLVIEVALFQGWGIVMWLVQMVWIPFWAAGVVNGVGHWWGYRNTDTPDCSRNIFPWGIIIGGEELHSNHHANPTGAKLSHKWWELDMGWMYIRILEMLGLAHVKRI